MSYAERFTSPPDIFTRPYRSVWVRDLPQIKAMGANVIRLYNWDPSLHAGDLSFLDACAVLGLYVIIPVSNYFLDHPQAAAEIVAQIARHPAVLMWGVSNEATNINADATSQKLSNARIAALAHVVRRAEEEIGTWHPITIPMTCDLRHVDRLREAGAPLDVWGFNCYWTDDEPWPASWYSTYAALSGAPLLFTEFGIDSYDNRVGAPFEQVQAEYTVTQWLSLMSPRGSGGLSLGGVVFEWMDEPWKAAAFDNRPAAAACTPRRHGLYAGWAPNAFPDSCGNDAFFGMAELLLDNTIRLKPVVDALSHAWFPRGLAQRQRPLLETSPLEAPLAPSSLRTEESPPAADTPLSAHTTEDGASSAALALSAGLLALMLLASRWRDARRTLSDARADTSHLSRFEGGHEEPHDLQPAQDTTCSAPDAEEREYRLFGAP